MINNQLSALLNLQWLFIVGIYLVVLLYTTQLVDFQHPDQSANIPRK